jgi:hypothetical protein
MKTAINWIHASTDLHHVGAHGTAEHSIFVWLGIVISGKKKANKSSNAVTAPWHSMLFHNFMSIRIEEEAGSRVSQATAAHKKCF